MKTPKEVMRTLLQKTPAQRKSFKPADGFEEIAKTYLEQALETKDAAMLKYVIEMVDEDKISATSTDIDIDSPEARARKFQQFVSEGINGE